mmetsp:Transcript_62652/g.136202  ORF Transcript_62652/g.136202 Transcript_62652/m.136202 type:complete len:277 (+) Transcript_62652:447-1277(+)
MRTIAQARALHQFGHLTTPGTRVCNTYDRLQSCNPFESPPLLSVTVLCHHSAHGSARTLRHPWNCHSVWELLVPSSVSRAWKHSSDDLFLPKVRNGSVQHDSQSVLVLASGGTLGDFFRVLETNGFGNWQGLVVSLEISQPFDFERPTYSSSPLETQVCATIRTQDEVRAPQASGQHRPAHTVVDSIQHFGVVPVLEKCGGGSMPRLAHTEPRFETRCRVLSDCSDCSGRAWCLQVETNHQNETLHPAWKHQRSVVDYWTTRSRSIRRPFPLVLLE